MPDVPTTVSKKYAYADDLAIMLMKISSSGRSAEKGHGNRR